MNEDDFIVEDDLDVELEVNEVERRDLSDTFGKETMPLDTFLGLPSVPHQRYTEGRAQSAKVKKMLSGHVRPEQLEVAIVELTEDCKYYNEEYKKGWRGIVNGNTRRLFWEMGWSKSVPTYVNATIYYLPDMEAVRDCYNTFDSMNATEITKEKLYGIISGMYNYTPSTPKIIKGEFLTALNLACHFYDPKVFYHSNAKPEILPSLVGTYIDEIIAFDNFCKRPKEWDQALICAAFMALKRYGVNNTNLLKCLSAIENRIINTQVEPYDSVTQISLEWKINDRFPIKVTNWDKQGGMKEIVSYALYWIEKYMDNKTVSQLGNNWRLTGKDWFKYYTKPTVVTNNVVPIDLKKVS